MTTLKKVVSFPIPVVPKHYEQKDNSSKLSNKQNFSFEVGEMLLHSYLPKWQSFNEFN